MQNKNTILVVDDQSINIDFIVTNFKDKYSIKVASNGKMALKVLDKFEIDLVLLDIQMPIMDGYQATRRIRLIEKERALNKTPIIALTAYALKEDYERCIAAGCDMHISKPVKKNILVDTLNKITTTTLNKVS